MSATFLYFAYGSNLKLSEIHRTCASAERHIRAKLSDHRIVFPRKSNGRGCGVAGLQPSAGDVVWGGVYCIAESERPNLEEREGYRRGRATHLNAYVLQEVAVIPEGAASEPLFVLTFIANPQPDPPLPSATYKQLIVDGAKEWQLGADYIVGLEKIATI
jgi:gamma-glutamylcyclotransferase (GGCT)/AIG2-like uncharacterized protein YtfP